MKKSFIELATLIPETLKLQILAFPISLDSRLDDCMICMRREHFCAIQSKIILFVVAFHVRELLGNLFYVLKMFF
jgi:hypothetical protein